MPHFNGGTRLLCYIIRVIVAAPDGLMHAPTGGVDPPRKHLPRKKIPSDLRSLARGHTELCIKVLAGIVSQEASPSAARVSAAGILLDRGWGKAISRTQARTAAISASSSGRSSMVLMNLTRC